MILSAISSQLSALRKSTLLLNALYLMLSTFVAGASGFVFWVIITRTHDTAVVGLATTLLSVSGLLALLGLAGFDTTFVRFLPSSHRKNSYINSGFIIVVLVSSALAILAALMLPSLTPGLAILKDPGSFLSFVFFTTVTALNVLTNAVFLAFKEARYIFIINASLSIFKITLPFIAPGGSVTTIVVMAGSAQLFGLALSIMWMKRKLGYKFSPILDMSALRVVKKFSFSMYASSFLNLLPPTLIPLIIIFHMGAKNAAYYYMAFTIAGVLYTVIYASMQSVFAEGSHNETAMRTHVTKAAKLIAILLLPAIILTTILSNVLLSVFGHEYADQASMLLRLFALGALPVALYSAMGAIFKVKKNLHGAVAMNVTYAVTILSLSYLWAPGGGLTAIGWAWIIGNTAACSVGAFFLINSNKEHGEKTNAKITSTRR